GVEGREYRRGAGGRRQTGGAGGRIVVADDELAGPAAALDHPQSGIEVPEGGRKKPLLVERRDDNRNLQSAGGATTTPLTPCFSTSWATRPERFVSSMNARRYFAAPALFFGTPIDCCTAVKWPSSTFEPGSFCASASSPGFRPASASSFCSLNSFTEAGMPSARTSCAFFSVRER